MTKIVSLFERSGVPINYEEVKIEPQQIVRQEPPLFLDNVRITDFPKDYIEFIKYFGEGLLGDYLRIFPVNFIDNLILPWRERTSKNKFFNNCSIITHEQLSKALIIGDTLDNAQFIYFEGSYYIYNVEIEEFIVNVGKSIKDIFEWFAAGSFYEPNMLNTFMPFDSYKTVSPLHRIVGGFFYDFERKF